MKKIQKALVANLLLLPLSLISCADRNALTITVSNETDNSIGPRLIELPAGEILSKLNSEGFYVADEDGQEVPSQLTHDSLILFKADVAPGKSARFCVLPCDSVKNYSGGVYGQAYPKRRDDISYENELVGFRIYGPGTMEAGEKAYGYDLFFKYPGDEIVVPQLYAPETDDRVWAKVDSLRAVDPKLADEFINTFSYHIDHGKGMDCYAVGATLGAGVAAIIENDSIVYPWCYKEAEILDNGPLRFTVRLDFAPVKIGDKEVTEHRLITLDSGQHLNLTKVWYDGLEAPVEIVAGFPLRDESEPSRNSEMGYIAYADPTQGPDNGKALLGISLDCKPDSIITRDNHILLTRKINPKDEFIYRWGFAWDRTDISNMEDWNVYLGNVPQEYTVKY